MALSGLPREQVISALAGAKGVKVFRSSENTIEIEKDGQLHRTLILRPMVERPLVERLGRDYGVSLSEFAPPILYAPPDVLTRNGDVSDLFPGDRACPTCGAVAVACKREPNLGQPHHNYVLTCPKGCSDWHRQMPAH